MLAKHLPCCTRSKAHPKGAPISDFKLGGSLLHNGYLMRHDCLDTNCHDLQRECHNWYRKGRGAREAMGV